MTEVSQDTGRVLVVDDHDRARQSMVDILTHVGYQVQSCASAIAALQLLNDQSFDVVITDLMMPGMNGVEFIRELQQREVESQVVMVTAHGTVETAVQAMRYGAFDYIQKPFGVDELEGLVGRAFQQQWVHGSRSMILNDLNQVGMLGDSPAMRQLKEKIAQVAPTDVTILITGESGTGKELVAQSIHAASQRTQGAMVSLNCPALSAQLMESELFGHEQGAFTSADALRVGRFELADGGTILLDEVTEIDLGLQAKLLRVLQEKSFERVGSCQTRQVDTRVIATTNRQLHHEVQEGNFRQDLYFRLAVVPLHVPPLRERSDDVGLLAQHFLAKSANRIKQPTCELTDSAIQLLSDYHWPGNVRELENLMTRASVMAGQNSITADLLNHWLIEPVEPSQPSTVLASTSLETEETSVPNVIPIGTNLQEMERTLIEATLEQYQGHRERTAKALGIGVRTLTNKLRGYGYAPREKSFAKTTMAKAA